ncbi:MAG: DUF3592 domain-containing protein [Phycisphaerales bacterium]|nr:MAG: DUF3592 domain-containing protein [Phycisphaerales bacterium]
MKMKAGLFLLLFGGIWTFVTMAFNIIMLTSAIDIFRAQQFAETTGTIIAAEVDRRRGSDSTSYAPALEYSYDIAGQTYTGTRYGVRDVSTSNRGYAARIVQDHQPGTEVVVYYDPNQPENAVLNREFSGPMMILPIFMTPFNAVMLGCWWIALSSIWIKTRRPIAGGYRVRYFPPLLNVRLSAISPVYGFLAGAGFTGFLLIFAILIPTQGDPSLAMVLWSMIGVVCGGVCGVFIAWIYNRSPKRWLTLDESTGEIILPTLKGRGHEKTVDRDSIEAIELMPATELEQRTGKRWASTRMGGRGSSQGDAVGHAVVFVRQPADDTETDRDTLIPVLICLSQIRAELFASWLAEQLDVVRR